MFMPLILATTANCRGYHPCLHYSPEHNSDELLGDNSCAEGFFVGTPQSYFVNPAIQSKRMFLSGLLASLVARLIIFFRALVCVALVFVSVPPSFGTDLHAVQTTGHHCHSDHDGEHRFEYGEKLAQVQHGHHHDIFDHDHSPRDFCLSPKSGSDLHFSRTRWQPFATDAVAALDDTLKRPPRMA